MSAGNTARSTLAAVRGDRVRALQHVLYRAAKADPDTTVPCAVRQGLPRGRAGQGVGGRCAATAALPGIDRVSLADVEEYGVSRLLGELAAELREGRYRPLPARRVLIPKPGTTEQRPLSIPAVRDRIVQAAVKIVLEPVFEADFLPCSFGFRPRRSAHDALQVLIDESWQGRRWVVETDIASCFRAIPHDELMQAIEERVCDQAVLCSCPHAAAGRGDGRRVAAAGGDRYSARWPVVTVALQRLPAPAGPGVGRGASTACWCATAMTWW